MIPDNHMDKAIKSLQMNGFEPCRNENCEYFTPAHRQCTASMHFDTDQTGLYGPIALYNKSRMLCWIDLDWKVDRPAPTDPHLTLDNWFNLPVWKEYDGGIPPSTTLDRYPVKLLEVTVLTQAVMYLYCRDYKKTDGRQHWWEPMLLALGNLEDVHGKRLVKNVGGFCQPYWADFIYPKHVSELNELFWDALVMLQAALIRNEWLPPWPILAISGLPQEIPPWTRKDQSQL